MKTIKQTMKSFVACAAMCGFAAEALASDWLRNSATLTEQVAEGQPWVLTVTVANSTELSVTKVTTDGTNMELDFSGSIKDASGTDYTIVSLDGFSGKPITKLVFPTGIRTTKRDAFLNCTSLVTVEPLIPDTITELGQRCFAGCTALEGEVVFPAHEVKSTYSWTNGTWGWFNGSKITTADLSAATMTEIVKESFANCANLKWVKLPKGVTTIGSDAFTGSAALETIEPFLPDTVTSFGSCPFRNCSSLTGDVKLTNRNAIILFTHHGNNSFGVFQGCSKIASFEMTAGITHNQDGEGYIDNNMFNGCSSLGSVILPANVKGLTRGGVFSGCTSLTNVTFLGWQAPTSFGKNAFDGVTDNLPRIFYPRLSPTWEAFVPTLTGFEPMSETLAATYLGKYPDATVLPLGRFKLYQRWVWVSDLENEDSNSYYVLGDPVEATDEGSSVTPAYGGYHGFANGETVEFTAPQIGGYNSGEYRCKGYALSYETSLRTWSVPVTNTGTSCSITQADDKVWRLAWLWGPNGYELNSTPINEGGTVTCDPPNTGLYEPGTVVTLTATADTANGYRFLCWTGDHAPTGDAAFDPVATVQMDDSRVIRAAFASSTWTYDGNKTMTDGNWVLTVKKTGTELSVESVVSAYAEDSIDFTRKIVDGNGEEYSVVWINGFQGKGLVEVVLPAGLRGLGKNAFYQCSKLRTVTPLLPASLTELGQCAFSQTAVEGDVVLPANVITSTYSWSNDAYGWFNGTQITSFDGSAATMTEVVNGSFRGCSKLKWVKLPQGVTTIGDNAFYEATALEAIEPFFPDTVTSVGRGVLYGNSIFSQPLILRGKADIVTTRNLNLSWDGVISGTKIPSADLSGGIVNLSNGCFGNASSLGSIILGPKLDTLEGSSLSAAGLTNVVFLGDAPSSIDNKTTFRDWASYQIVVTLPLAKPGWQAYAANHFRDPTVEEKTSYRAKYPNGRKLSKIWTQVNQGTTLIYVCDSKNTGMKILFR